mmetsp:Transcript_16651/g.23458  ORF Transcript_16651/g.23458 Transcript_16651/m.23458 type:complete len:376 (+) Transcript_16651:139-1266(+)
MSRLVSILEEASNLCGTGDLDDFSSAPAFVASEPKFDMSSLIKAPIVEPLSEKEVKKEADSESVDKATEGKKRTWKKPKDKPKRPLSAYNLFFQHERNLIVTAETPAGQEPPVLAGGEKKKRKRRHRKTHGKISFADLARTIADKWKNTAPEGRAPFEAQAAIEKARYLEQLEAWKKSKENPEQSATKSTTEGLEMCKQPGPIAPCSGITSMKPCPTSLVGLFKGSNSPKIFVPNNNSSQQSLSSLMMMGSVPQRQQANPPGRFSLKSHSSILDATKQTMEGARQALNMPNLGHEMQQALFQLDTSSPPPMIASSTTISESSTQHDESIMWDPAFDPTPIRENATPENVGSNAAVQSDEFQDFLDYLEPEPLIST